MVSFQVSLQHSQLTSLHFSEVTTYMFFFNEKQSIFNTHNLFLFFPVMYTVNNLIEPQQDAALE